MVSNRRARDFTKEDTPQKFWQFTNLTLGKLKKFSFHENRKYTFINYKKACQHDSSHNSECLKTKTSSLF